MITPALRGVNFMERKLLSISSKRQITIPQKFFNMLGFGSEAECLVRGNELIIRPVETRADGEFAEQILADLIKQGYSGDELLIQFRNEQKKIRPAVEAMLAEAKKLANDNSAPKSIDDIFGTEDNE